MLYRISLSESFVSKYAPQIYQYQQRASQHQQQQQEQRSSQQQQSNRVAVEDEQTTAAAIEQQQQTTPILSNETLTPIEQQKRFIPHEQLIDQLAASIGQSLQEKYEEELATLKKQNVELQYQNSAILNHLQDGRQIHIEKEVGALMSIIPQRSATMVYKCQSQNDALRQCYQTHLNNKKTSQLPEDHVIQLDMLKCRPLVNQFVECASETRREFLRNSDL